MLRLGGHPQLVAGVLEVYQRWLEEPSVTMGACGDVGGLLERVWWCSDGLAIVRGVWACGVSVVCGCGVRAGEKGGARSRPMIGLKRSRPAVEENGKEKGREGKGCWAASRPKLGREREKRAGPDLGLG